MTEAEVLADLEEDDRVVFERMLAIRDKFGHNSGCLGPLLCKLEPWRCSCRNAVISIINDWEKANSRDAPFPDEDDEEG